MQFTTRLTYLSHEAHTLTGRYQTECSHMQDMPRTTDVLIVGGGVIGCAIAYYLCQAGAEVILLDQGEVGAEASSAAAGLLAPLGSLTGPGPFADLLLASWSLFPALVADLEEVSGVQIEYEQTGALRVVRNPRNIANLKRRMQAWEPLGLRMDWLI
ncbi:MAG: FAD-dependent oxidoreductase, partial [Ktedonobacteraceae bacterium]